MIYTKHIKHINVRENRRSNQEKIIFIVRYIGKNDLHKTYKAYKR